MAHYQGYLHANDGEQEQEVDFKVPDAVLHEVVVFLGDVEAEEADHPDATNAEEVVWGNLPDVLQEEESEVVGLELLHPVLTKTMKKTIFRKCLREVKALVSRSDRCQVLKNLFRLAQWEYWRGASLRLQR